MLARITTLGLTIVAGFARAVLATDPTRVFDLPSGRPTSIVVTRSVDAPPDLGETSPMLQELAGVLGTLAPRDFSRLRTMIRAGQPPESLDGATLVGVMHLQSPAVTKRVEILQLPDSTLIASEVDPLDPEGQSAAVILPREFNQLTTNWSRYQGGFGPTDTPLGACVDMPHPYLASPVTFDPDTLSTLHGVRATRGTARDLEIETLWVRLPSGYDPRTPAGLILWVDPSESGRPPEFMHSAADAMNFIIVGAGSAGNDRYVADRHQLGFDAMANATARYHVDPSRVYAAGVSGGARLTSMYWGGYSDIFSGAIAIVGAAAYEAVPIGNNQFVPREYVLGDGARERLRKHRLAAMSGPSDFNFVSIERIIHSIDMDGYPARLFEYEDMGHDNPTPQRFTDVLKWVDTPWWESREESIERATVMLEGVKRRAEDTISPAAREALVRVTTIAPWSEPAWEAARMLGYE